MGASSETTVTITSLELNEIGRFKKRDITKAGMQASSAFTARLLSSRTKEERKEGAPGTARDALYTSMRALLGSPNVDILQGGQLTPSTTNMYKILCKKHNKKPNTVDLGDGARGHWIGDSNARSVMLYFPGGAFIMPCTYAHYEFMFHARKRAHKRFHDFAIFCLDYTLVPHAVYPTQLRQAVSALRYLVQAQNRSPRTIMIAGDSAGGNLTAAVLLHLVHPHPAIPPLKLSAPLHSAMMISPWISFSTDMPSMVSNAKKDLLTAPAIGKAGRAYVRGTSNSEIHAEPILASPEIWSDVASRVVGDALITAGANELLSDEILIFASKLKSGFDADVSSVDWMEAGSVRKGEGKSRVQIHVCEGEAHDEVIIDYFTFNRGKGKSAKVVKNWMAEVL